VETYFFLALALAFLVLVLVFFPELHPHVLHICQSFHIRLYRTLADAQDFIGIVILIG